MKCKRHIKTSSIDLRGASASRTTHAQWQVCIMYRMTTLSMISQHTTAHIMLPTLHQLVGKEALEFNNRRKRDQ